MEFIGSWSSNTWDSGKVCDFSIFLVFSLTMEENEFLTEQLLLPDTLSSTAC